MSKFAVILAAAGSSSRFANPRQKKVYTLIGNKPMWMFAAEAFADHADVDQVIMVIAPDDKELFSEKHAASAAMLGIQIVLGGSQRADSVKNGLEAVREDIEYVAVHDAARPCIAKAWIDAVFAAAQKHAAAILATRCVSTLKRADAQNQVVETLSRDKIWLAQTPQAFKKSLLVQAYAKHPNASAATDEAGIVEASGHAIQLVEGSPLNIKVTTQADMKFAELALKALPKPKAFPF